MSTDGDDFGRRMEVTMKVAAKLKAKMLEKKLTAAWTRCPECGGRLDARLAGRKNHMRLWCEKPGCVQMME